jgi:hypothetical protein
VLIGIGVLPDAGNLPGYLQTLFAARDGEAIIFDFL